MKVSVIIPAYNEESNIAATLEAVLSQSYPDFEVIVINNNSTDKTAEVVKQYPVKLVHEDKRGTLWACERGRQEAQGEIVVRMDADCLPHKHWIDSAVRLFRNDSEIVAVSGPYFYHDSSPTFKYSSFWAQKYLYRPINSTLQRFKKGGIMVGGNSFFRADTLDKMGGFNTEITFYGDETDTSKRLAKHGKIIFHNDLIMPTSARRFKNEGTLKITALYWYHFLKGLFKKTTDR